MKRQLTLLSVILAALIATRWALAPKYLFYIDNVNFALAMDHFQPLLHQPHPPGYPFYVALLDILHLAIPSIKFVQLVSGSIGSLISLVLIWKLGDDLFGAPCGAIAAALLFFVPAFWLAGIGDQVRTFIAAGSVAVALCAWKAMQPEQSGKWLLAGAATLGVAGGFRPELLILLFPLLCLAWFQGSRKIPTAFGGLALLGVVAALWLTVLIWRTGGIMQYRALLYSQWTYTTVGTTVFSGARLNQNLFNAALTIYWTGVSTLSWIGALAVVWRELPNTFDRRRLLFLTCWFLPPFLFHALIYMADPDTALDCIPVLLVLGGCVVSIAVRQRSSGEAWVAVTAAMAVNVAIFFLSPLHQGKDASFEWIQLAGSETTKAVDGIAALSRDPTTVILDRALVTPRQIAYYFPLAKIVSLDGSLEHDCSARLPPGPERVIYIPRFTANPSPGPPFQLGHGLAFTDLGAHSRFRIGACVLAN